MRRSTFWRRSAFSASNSSTRWSSCFLLSSFTRFHEAKAELFLPFFRGIFNRHDHTTDAFSLPAPQHPRRQPCLFLALDFPPHATRSVHHQGRLGRRFHGRSLYLASHH